MTEEPASTPPVRRKVLIYRAADGERRAFPYQEQGGVARSWPDDVTRILDTYALGDFLYAPDAWPDASEPRLLTWAAGPVTAIRDDGSMAIHFLGGSVAVRALTTLRVPDVPLLELTVPRSDFFHFASGSEHECRRQMIRSFEDAEEAVDRGRNRAALDFALQGIALFALWGEALVDAARRRGGPDEELAADPARTFFRLSRLQSNRVGLHALAHSLVRSLEEGEPPAHGEASVLPPPRPRFLAMAVGLVVVASALGAGLAAWGASAAIAGILLLGLALSGVRVLRGHDRGWLAAYAPAMTALSCAMAHHLAQGNPQPGSVALLLAAPAAAVFAVAVGCERTTRFRSAFLRPSLALLIGFPLAFGLFSLHDSPPDAPAPAWLVAWGAVLGTTVSLLRTTTAVFDASAPVDHPSGSRGNRAARSLFIAAVATALLAAFVSVRLAWLGSAACAYLTLHLLPRMQRRIESFLLAVPVAAAPYFLASGRSDALVAWISCGLFCLPFALADDAWPPALAQLGEWLFRTGRHAAARRVFESLCETRSEPRWIGLAARNCERLGDYAGAAEYLARIGAHEAAGDAFLRAVRELPCMPPPALEPERAPAPEAEEQEWKMP